MQSHSLLAFNIMQPPRFLFVCLFISLCYSFNCPRFLPITLPLVPPSSTLSWPPKPPPPPPPPTQKKKEIILKWLCYHFSIEHTSTTDLLVCAVQTQLLWTGLSVVSISTLLFLYIVLSGNHLAKNCKAKIEHYAEWEWVRELELNLLCFVARQLRTPTWYTAIIAATRDSPALHMDSAVHWMRIPTNL